MNALAVRLLLVLALLAGAYWAGDHNRNNAWLAKQAKVERKAKADYEAEVKRGNDASGAFLVEHQEMQTKFENLTEKFNGLSKRIPLLAGAGGRSGINSCHGGSIPPQSNADANGLPDADAARAGVLTAGAVWMWNSALAGTDQPSGACGSADTSEAACAVATPLDLDDAWANHRANAQTCALNRLAHDRLIDFLTSKENAK